MTVAAIKMVTPERACSNCGNYRRMDWARIQTILKNENVSDEVMKQFHLFYARGLFGRCSLTDRIMAKEDWCDSWKPEDEREVDQWWPASKKEFLNKIENLG